MHILPILAEFQQVLFSNLGKPINLAIVAAFSKMMYELLGVVKEDS